MSQHYLVCVHTRIHIVLYFYIGPGTFPISEMIYRSLKVIGNDTVRQIAYEFLFVFYSIVPPAYLLLCGESVATFKLLGVYVSCVLKWSEHVDAIVSKAASRLHFLKQLKRAGALIRDLLHFYISVLRPVLEYACPV